MRRSNQPITWIAAGMAQAQLQTKHRGRVRVVSRLIEASGFWVAQHRYAAQEGLHPRLLQGATANLCRIFTLPLQSLRCQWLWFGGAGPCLGQEGEVGRVLIPGCAVVGTHSPEDVFVLVDKNCVVLLCNTKMTGRGVLWCQGHEGDMPEGTSEVLLPESLLRICDGSDTHCFQPLGHSSLPTQPWSLEAMMCQEDVPQAAPTTKGYLGATRGTSPGDLQTSLGPVQSQCRDGQPWQSHECRC